MAGVATGSLGEGLGEVNGDAVELFALANAGRGPSPGGGCTGVAVLGLGELDSELGVPARCIQGAGERDRMCCMPRAGGGLDFLSLAAFHLHSAPRTASSSALPLSELGGVLNSSSSLSVFSSSPSFSSFSVGSQSSYILSDTIMSEDGCSYGIQGVAAVITIPKYGITRCHKRADSECNRCCAAHMLVKESVGGNERIW